MNDAGPTNLKHKLRKTRKKIMQIFAGVFSGLVHPFCAGCNVFHKEWTELAGKPWFCLRCFRTRSEINTPWHDNARFS